MGIARNIAVIGLGTFGGSVARELTRLGDRVMGIDIDAQTLASFSNEFDLSIQADASDPKALKECALDSYDAVIVSIGENLQASILTALNVLELGCTSIWVKAQNESHKKILTSIGIKNVVLPEQTQGKHIAQIVHNPRLSDFLILENEHYIATVPVTGRLLGTSLERNKVLEKYGLTCLGISNKEGVETQNLRAIDLSVHHTIILCGNRAHLRKFTDSL